MRLGVSLAGQRPARPAPAAKRGRPGGIGKWEGTEGWPLPGVLPCRVARANYKKTPYPITTHR
jgi:hypothetical protein